MPWGEAVRLYGIVSADPSSALFAASSGWVHPFSWEALILADLLDVQVAKASSKKRRPKPWHRPWTRKDKSTKRMGTPVSIAEFEAMRERARNAASKEIDLSAGR